MNQSQTKTAKSVRPLSLPAKLLCALLVVSSTICLFSAHWYVQTYGNTGFDSILFTLQSSVSGAESTLVYRFLIGAILPAVLASAGFLVLLFYIPCRFPALRKLRGSLGIVAALALSMALSTNAAVTVELDGGRTGLQSLRRIRPSL